MPRPFFRPASVPNMSLEDNSCFLFLSFLWTVQMFFVPSASVAPCEMAVAARAVAKPERKRFL